MEITIEKLNDTHLPSFLKSLVISDKELREFLRNRAKKHQKHLIATTYLIFADGNFVGYFALSCDSVPIEDIDVDLPSGKRYKTYPAVKIGRFAIGDDYRLLHIGSKIIDTIKSTLAFGDNLITARFITVDAYKGAVKFYAKMGFDFQNIDNSEDNDTIPMYYDLHKIIPELSK
ncbi:MAG: GNAT family N-acetyltransferase [Salinivirgaceae bacterium]|nr:GNAT family N-acetyltransferase [Salinivirgaceae bacterium]